MAAHVLRGTALDSTQRILKAFIDEYRASPELWDPRNGNYSNKYRRIEAQDRLLAILRRLHSNATRIDVRKKINTFRSNFNKKVGMVRAAEAEGRVYNPKSWLYHELRFLETIKRSDGQIESLELDSEDGNVCVEEVTEDITNQIKFEISYPAAENYIEVGGNQEIVEESQESDLIEPIVKKQRFDFSVVDSSSMVQRKPKAKNSARRRDSKDRLNASNSSVTAIEPVALVWSSKLQSLQPTQRLLAEKAINDILFEASMNNLQKGPMVINAGLSSVSYAEAEGFQVAQEEFVEYASSDDRDEC